MKLLGRDALLAAVERVGMLLEPQDETYLKELRKFHRKIRYVPGLLAGLELGAAPAGRPLVDAVEYLREVHAGVKRPGPVPTAFAPADWLPQIRTGEGSFDLTGYRLCVLDSLRRAFRRAPLAAQLQTHQYAWQIRPHPAGCRHLGRTRALAESDHRRNR